jgi:hypothetical protein
MARGRQVAGSVPNLVNGISQQSPALRLPSQAEASTNYYPTLVEGLSKRPRTDHLAFLDDLPEGTFTHIILRDDDEKYVLAVEPDGTIRVWDFEGDEKTVTDDSDGYLAGLTDPATELKALTVIDHTFVVNKTKTVTQRSDTEPTRPYEALINVAAGNYGKTYRIFIDGTISAYVQTPSGGDASHAFYVDTTYIADVIYRGLAGVDPDVDPPPSDTEGHVGAWPYGDDADEIEWGGLGGFNTSPWALGRYQSTVYIRNTTTDFTISTEDGYNGRAMKAAKKYVQHFSDLPLYGPEGVVIEVKGTDSTSFDNYWVKFNKDDDAEETGVWEECVAPGSKLGFDADTMPHQLIRNGDGTFTFQAATWEDRKCGDEESVPDPSFVGATIQDLFFHKNRLGLLTKDNVLMSASGQFYNFYRSTLTALLDTDPIDVAASHIKASVLRHAVLFQKELLVFSDQTQFVVRGNDLLTPKTVNADPITELSAAPLIRPEVSASSVYFVAEGDQWAHLYEYFLDKALETADYDDVSAHAPVFVPAGVNRLIASPDFDMVLVTSSGEPDAIFAYKFYFNGQERIQSAWTKWTYPMATEVLNMAFDKGKVRVLFRRGSGVYLESFAAEQALQDPGLDYTMYLDRSVVLEEGVYDSGDDTTTFTIPYPNTTGITAVTVPGGELPAGVELPPVSVGTGEVVLAGDLSEQPIRFGFEFDSRHRLSTLYLRSDDGKSVEEAGRLQVLGLSLVYAKSAYFRVEVTCEGRAMRTYAFNGNVTGSSENETGELAIQNGKLAIPIMSRNDRVIIELVNDTWLPSNFISAKWRGTWNPSSLQQ